MFFFSEFFLDDRKARRQAVFSDPRHPQEGILRQAAVGHSPGAGIGTRGHQALVPLQII